MSSNTDPLHAHAAQRRWRRPRSGLSIRWVWRRRQSNTRRWRVCLGLGSLIAPLLAGCAHEPQIVDDIGAWSYQDGLMLETLEVQPQTGGLDLFNGHFDAVFHLTGSLKHSSGWRPRVCKLQYSARWEVIQLHHEKPRADILLQPVVCVARDKHYHGESIPFDVQFRHPLSTGGLGKNLYHVHAGELSRDFEVVQGR